MQKILMTSLIIFLIPSPSDAMFKRLFKLMQNRHVTRACTNAVQNPHLFNGADRQRDDWPTVRYGLPRLCEVTPESRFCTEYFWPDVEENDDLLYHVTPAAERESPSCAARVLLREITSREFRKCVEEEKNNDTSNP